MLRTNEDRLVKISVVGEVSSPVFGRSPYRISADGHPVVLPSVGGITYNIRVGDLACGWQADLWDIRTLFQRPETCIDDLARWFLLEGEGQT